MPKFRGADFRFLGKSDRITWPVFIASLLLPFYHLIYQHSRGIGCIRKRKPPFNSPYLADDVKRLFKVNISRIEGGADDGAFGAEGFEHLEVVQGGDTARGDDGLPYGIDKLGGGGEVGLGEGAVAADIGIDEALYSQGGH